MPPLSNYKEPSSDVWQGRVDGKNSQRLHQIVQHLDLNAAHLPHVSYGPAFGLLGFASDEGIRRNLGKSGAYDGPLAIRKALANLPTARPAVQIFDCGDICCDDQHLESAQQALGLAVSRLLDLNLVPLLIGGGHEIAWGHYLGILAKYPKEKLAIFNFDAHFDLREPLEGNKSTSGSSFSQIMQHARQAKRPVHYNCLGIQRSANTDLLFQKAEKYQAKYMYADEFYLGGIEPALEFVDEQLKHVEIAYVSICLDVFAAAFAPGVSAPQVLGLMPWHIIPVLHRLSASGKLVALDIAELSPKRDRENMTASLAAQLLYQVLIKFKLGY